MRRLVPHAAPEAPAIGVLNSAARMARLRFPPGVHKHRSIEDMDAQQVAWRRLDGDPP